MRILFLLLVALFISPTFAQVDERNICYINDSDHSFGDWKPTIPKECEVGDILHIQFSNNKQEKNTPRLASEFCDYEKQIKIEHQYLSCVLKTKTPRKKKKSRQPF